MSKDVRDWFDPRFGKRPSRFVGRDAVLRDIGAALRDNDELGRDTILTGIKGSGKSSILSAVRAGVDGAKVFFFGEPGNEKAQLKAGESEFFGGSGLDMRGVSGAVYIVDDADKDTPGLRQFLVDYAEQIRQGENVKLILAGLPHKAVELLTDDGLAFLRRARSFALENVRVDEVFAFYKEAFAGVNAFRGEDGDGAAAENVLLRAAEATAGYPYMIQLIGYYLSKEEKGIDDKAADKAIFLSKIELYKNIHDPLIWGLSSKDRMFLWAMSQDEGASEFGEIARRMDVSAGYASKYRERLINAGAIYRSAYGELAFTLPFMKEYVQKEFIERLGGEYGKRRL